MLLFLTISSTFAYPSGSPVCSNDLRAVTMRGVKNFDQPGGYVLRAGTVTAGKSVDITITATSGGPIRGFLLYAESSTGQRVGQFTSAGLLSASATSSGPLPGACNKGDTATHSRTLGVNTITLPWTPPTMNGQYTFKAIVFSAGQFWNPTPLVVDTIPAAAVTPATQPATQRATPATQPATVKPATQAPDSKPEVAPCSLGLPNQIRSSQTTTSSLCLALPAGEEGVTVGTCNGRAPQRFLLSKLANGYVLTTTSPNNVRCVRRDGSRLYVESEVEGEGAATDPCAVFQAAQSSRSVRFKIGGTCLTLGNNKLVSLAACAPTNLGQLWFVEPRL